MDATTKIKLVLYTISVVLIIPLVYGYMYSLFPREEFGFLEPIDPYYYSFTTFSTVGYGDFKPLTARAKLLTITQQIISLFQIKIILFG